MDWSRTDFVDKAGEGWASGPTCQPEHDGVLLRLPLRFDEVVEEAAVIHLHVPWFKGERERSMEAREMPHHGPLLLVLAGGGLREDGEEEEEDDDEEEAMSTFHCLLGRASYLAAVVCINICGSPLQYLYNVTNGWAP